MRTAIKALGRRTMRLRSVRSIAISAAARHRRALVVVYHRIVPDERLAGEHPVVPTVPAAVLRRHLEVLADLGEIVPLEFLLGTEAGGRRPRFAVTFDDDYAEHATVALPLLEAHGAHATFFLSGRSLHGLGAYWWQQLEWLVRQRGPIPAARLLGLRPGSAVQLAEACETDAEARNRLRLHAPDDLDGLLDAAAIRTVAAARGITIGFHTLHHDLLTQLTADQVRSAVSTGRRELEVAARSPVRLFAYPHGKATAAAAEAVRSAGYAAAWTGRPAPIRRGDDPFRLGRWECGPLAVDRFAAAVAIRLNRAAPA